MELVPLDKTKAECSGCQRLEGDDALIVELGLTGCTVCTHCPAWRDECLDRHKDAMSVLMLNSKDQRRAYVEARRGDAGDVIASRLETAVREEHARRRAAAEEVGGRNGEDA